MFDVIGLVKAALELAKPVVDLVVFNKIMAYVHDYEDNEKAIAATLAAWPNTDDAALAAYLLERKRLQGALKLQLSVAQPGTKA